VHRRIAGDDRKKAPEVQGRGATLIESLPTELSFAKEESNFASILFKGEVERKGNPSSGEGRGVRLNLLKGERKKIT